MSAIAYIVVCLWLFFVNVGQTGITVCPSKLLYHIPCPGCGVTRATLLAIHGNITEAILLNPNCLLAILFIILYPIIVLASLIKKRPYLSEIYDTINKKLANKKVLFTILFIETLIWIHNIVAHI